VQPDSFAALVRQHQPALSRFVARYLRDRREADDIVQDTFLRAWQQIGRFRPGTNFLAWLFTIARFLCMARRQDQKRHPPPSTLDPRHEPAAPPLPENLERLKQACESLPAHQREVVQLRFFDALDYRAIAEITGEREVTLRSRMHDALERLRGLLTKSL